MRIALLVVFGGLLSGCLVDTCPGGATFSTMSLTGTPMRGDQRLGLAFKPNPELPGAYYAAVKPGTPESKPDAVLVSSVQVVDAGVFEVALPREIDGGVSFTLDLPDRRSFVRCSHPGMDDVVKLDVQVTLPVNGTPQFSVSERVQLGAL